MRDEPARDAVRNALDRDVPYLGPGGREQRVENVLAALGIPPDATTDEVRAGLALWRNPFLRTVEIFPVANGHFRAYVERVWKDGPTPAAAVLALAARIEERS